MNVDITFLPSGRTATVRAGTTVLDASRKAGVPIRTRCGGKAACLMCKVVTNGEGLTRWHERDAGLKPTAVLLRMVPVGRRVVAE